MCLCVCNQGLVYGDSCVDVVDLAFSVNFSQIPLPHIFSHIHPLSGPQMEKPWSNSVKFTDKLKADWPHPRYYSTHRQTPWTNNDCLLFAAALGKGESLILTATHQKFDLDLWSWPWSLSLTYNPYLAKVKVDPNTKNQGRRSKVSAVGYYSMYSMFSYAN